MVVGIIVRNHTGDIFVAMCSQKRYVVLPFLVKYNALWRSMELCRELGFREIIFERDAKEVTEGVYSEMMDESGRGQVVEDLKAMLYCHVQNGHWHLYIEKRMMWLTT